MNYTHKLSRRLARLRPAAVFAACGRWTSDRKIGNNRAVQHHLACRTLPILTLVLLLAACADSSAPAAPDAGAVDMYQVGRGWARRLVGIRISPDTAVVLAGQTVAFKASGVLTDGSSRPITVAWSATGGTIDSAGLFTAGSTTGAYHVVGTELIVGLVDSAAVVDTAASVDAPAPAVSSVSVSPASATLAVGESVQLSATAKDVNGSPVDGSAVTWTTSNSAVASVSSSGVVKALASGSSTVMATIQGVEGKANITVEATTGTVSGDCGSYPHDRLVTVSTASQLMSALTNARPGDLIELAAGTYTGHFQATASGTASQRIVLCGPQTAILDGGDYTSATFWLKYASYWTLKGFRVRRSLVGVLGWTAAYNVVDSLEIETTGYGGIVFHTHSKHNMFRGNYIHDTGKLTAEFGEGIYLGTSNGNWCTRTDCQPDRSDSNTVTGNVIGPNIQAQMVDVKDGTTGNALIGNRYDGAGQSLSVLNNDAWVNIYGNNVRDSANVGINGHLRDGYKVQSLISGWGQYNTFQYDTLDGGGSSGYGFSVGPTTNKVMCSNIVTGFSGGLSNVACVK
jgi:hypothetical protein